MMWRETYTYDANGNRATKTTPWGTIEYEYDEENRLVRRGDIEYTNDMDGNVLSEKGLRYEAHYEYNGQNRMTYSETTSHADRTHAASFYAYDALGRRTLTESITGQMLRTVYDGRSFEAIREGETFRDRSLTTQFATSEGARARTPMQSNQPTGERYRWISEDYNGGNTSADGYSIDGGSRYGGRGVTLYGNGEAVAVSYSSSMSSRSVYLGKDILGSVRTATTDGGAVEDRYEYDAFGQAYKGDLSGGMNLGYTGKPYDAGTGLYNYGYRDYRPGAARFTTADPIRDGSNWYAYVNNDPVNWVDPWGLDKATLYQEFVSETGGGRGKPIGVDINLFDPDSSLYISVQSMWHPPETFIVAGHGDDESLGDDRNGINQRVLMNAEEIADMIRRHPNYSQEYIVILFACEAGKTPANGADTLGQQVADALGPGAIVLATEFKFLMPAADGKYYIGVVYNGLAYYDSSKPYSQYEGFQWFTGRCSG
jgi:RHS repeat-associated protein